MGEGKRRVVIVDQETLNRIKELNPSMADQMEVAIPHMPYLMPSERRLMNRAERRRRKRRMKE